MSAGLATDDNAQGIARHENDDHPHQAQGRFPIANADGHCEARGIPAHERDEVSGCEKTDRIGHACQHTERRHQAQPDPTAP